MDAIVGIAEQVITMAPVPFLQPAAQCFKIIWTQVSQVKSNKRQIQIITKTIAQMLLAINSQACEDPSKKWEGEKWMQQNLQEFEKLLSDIAEFSVKLTKKKFVKSFIDAAADQSEINSIHVRLNLAVDAFQISSQISSQNYSRQVELARQEDQAEINAALKQLLEKQDSLLSLIGTPEENASQTNVEQKESDASAHPETPATIFGLLGDIQDSVKHAERDETLQEVLVELRKVAEPPPVPAINPNPVLAHLKPGLKPEVLIAPIQNHMKQYTWDAGLSFHLTSKQCYQFENSEDRAKEFIELLVSSDDQALQYAALEAFRKDKAVKHFFKKKDLYVPTENPNPLLAFLKPGLELSIVTAPIQYKMQDYSWKGSIATCLTSQQHGSFFYSGAEGCKRYLDYLLETDDTALQTATLDVFRLNPAIGFFFLPEPKEESD